MAIRPAGWPIWRVGAMTSWPRTRARRYGRRMRARRSISGAAADAASATRDQFADLLDARQLAAAPAGQDALFAAWQALASVAL
jgi:hypothetical protein